MDPLSQILTGIIIARQIKELFDLGKPVSEEQIAAIVAKNLVDIRGSVDIAKAEMAKYT